MKVEFRTAVDFDFPHNELYDIICEYGRATQKFASFCSAHEGYAVILEELDELWDCIKNDKTTTPLEMYNEAKQVAAMALRFMVDIYSKQLLDDAEKDKG
jgi:hypothetical protein